MNKRWIAGVLVALSLLFGACTPGDDEGGAPQDADAPAENAGDGY
jgi:hypothetical protein